MIKTQLIIDGHYLLFRGVYILKKNRSIKEDLEEMLFNDIKKITHAYSFDQIYFVSDKGSSWRKDVFKEYKERDKDNSIDWDSVYEIYGKFKNKLSKRKNIKILQKSNIEGDDFIAYITKKGNSEGYSTMIVASDVDIDQVLKFDLNNNWINFRWNYKFTDERIYLPENYQLFIDKIANFRTDDIFELGNEYEFTDYIKGAIKRAQVKEVRSEESLFCKIVYGDSSDNISSVIKLKDGVIDNEEGRGIGKEGALSVYKIYKESYPEIIDFHSDKFVNQLVEVISYYKKIKEQSIKDEIYKNICFNRRLICLDIAYMPKEILESMKEEYELKNIIVESTEIENLEEKLEEEGYFDEQEDLKEEFRREDTGEKFKDDEFWKLDGEVDAFDPGDFWKV